MKGMHLGSASFVMNRNDFDLALVRIQDVRFVLLTYI